jgi:hypothetical protein
MIRRLAALLAAAVFVAASCSTDDGSAADPPSTGATEETSPVGSTAVPVTDPVDAATTTEAPGVTEAPDPPDAVEVGEWQAVDAGADCMCADGSEFELWERPADPTKVVLYLEGGGACFSAETCDFEDGTYTSSLQLGTSPDGRGGIFDATNPENPLAEHSFVYVPYCSGDVHIGNAVTEYSPELTVRHNGFTNASRGLEQVLANYPDVEQLVVTGVSAGSVPTPVFAALAAETLTDTDIITFGDGSGAYPDVPVLNETIGAVWGTASVIPDWPENEGLTAREWSLPGLYVQAGKRSPRITFSRVDYAFDEVQAFFAALAGVPSNELVTLIDRTEAQIEAAGVPLASYIAPGNSHTVIGRDEFYQLEVEGVRLVDFLATLVRGDVPDDVRCVACTTP